MARHDFFDSLSAVDRAMGGWVDCSEMTTAAAINAAIAAAPDGSTIWLGPRPASAPLVIDVPIVVYGRRRILGAGGRTLQTIIEPSGGFTGGAMMAAEGWINNAGDADEPIIIEGIRFDQDNVSGLRGLVVYNFWSHCEDLHFVNGNGSAADAILCTDRASNGTTTSSNSHSENTFVRCRFDETFNGARQFRAESFNNASNQDGHITDSFFAGADGPAISLGRAAGWTVENNHLYGCGDNAIDALLCYGTKIIGNYVEDFGRNNVTSGPTGGFYTGISCSFLDGRPSVVALNTVSLLEPATVVYNRATCIGLRAGSGQLDARVSLIGNYVTFANGDATGNNAEGYRMGEGADSSRMLHVMWAGNGMDPRGTFESQISKAGATVRNLKDAAAVRSYTGVTGTHTLDNEFEMIQNLTLTGNVEIDPPASNVNARDGEPFQLRCLASGGTRTVTFDSTMRTSTGVTRGPHSVASGEVLFAAVEWSSLCSDYVITAVTVSAN